MVKVMLIVPVGSDPDCRPTERYFPNNALVCVETSPGIHIKKQADQLTTQDKLCMFSGPKPGPGVSVSSVEVL